MSLDVALGYALSGLNATQAQLQVVSGNIANAQTPGYSEETLAQTSSQATNGGAAVVTGLVQRAVDGELQTATLAQTSVSSAAASVNSYAQQIQTIIGQVGSGNTIGDALNNFAAAMQTVATNPQDPVAEQSAVNSGQQLAQSLNSLSSNIQALRKTADSGIGTDVTTLNSALTAIGTLNGEISSQQALGESTAALQDQRDQQLTQVAQLIGVSSYTRADGTMVVMTTQGKTLVDGTNARQFSFTPSGVVAASSPLSGLTLDGLDVTGETTSGEIGALLQTRDTTLPGLTAQLNQLTNNLFGLTTTATLQTTNSGLGATNDAKHFFADVNIGAGVDNAASIEVNPDLTANAALLDTGVGGPDPTIAATLSANLSNTTPFAAAGNLGATTTTLSNYVGQIIGNTATTASAATTDATDQSALLTQMQGQYSAATGVNLDAELGTLITYQNAYSASARVITTIQTMFQALMNA